jgi:hypothetical protein
MISNLHRKGNVSSGISHRSGEYQPPAKRPHHEINSDAGGRLQLLIVNPELQTHLGTKYIDETDLLPLLLERGFIRHVRTLDVEVQPLGGDSFKVTLDANRPFVSEAKTEIARRIGRPANQQELYKVVIRADGGVVREDDAEPVTLDDESIELANGEVIALAVAEDPPVVWQNFPKDRVALSEGGMVATQTAQRWSLTTTGVEMTEGKHYSEVQLLSESMLALAVGVSKPNLEMTDWYGEGDSTDGWFMCTTCGALHGNGKVYGDSAGTFQQGDRVGVLLDLDVGSLLFFKNGKQHGPGYPPGSVTGPVVFALQMYWERSVKLLPHALRPEQQQQQQ